MISYQATGLIDILIDESNDWRDTRVAGIRNSIDERVYDENSQIGSGKFVNLQQFSPDGGIYRDVE